MTVSEFIHGDSAATGASASGSSFYTAMRILPLAQRGAMFEIYAFCRAVDDIADGDAGPSVRVERLQTWRADIDALFKGRPPPRLAALAGVTQTFGLEQADFHAVIDGMLMDAKGPICAPSAAELDLYCDRVASAVGRLSVKVFGMEHDEGIELSHHLGRALQLTNILRDIDEDAALGRLYLPREALVRGGVTAWEPRLVARDARLEAVCAPLARQALEYYGAAEVVMARNARRTVRAPRIMVGIYRAILERMLARGWAPPRERVRVPRARVALVLLRYALL